MKKDSDRSSNDATIVDLASFRKKKSLEDELSPDRRPLYVSHLRGKMTGSPHFRRPEADDFGDRLSRIRSSLEKINRLMSELKKMSAEHGEDVSTRSRRS